MAAPALQTLEHLLAPWQSTFSNSKPIATAVIFVHLGALLFGGGIAVATDRMMLRARHRPPGELAHSLRQLHAAHRPVLTSVALLFVSGLLMVTADIETFAKSPVYWIKMALVLLLLANGIVLTTTETELRRTPDVSLAATLWKRLLRSARVSIVLWTAVVLAGTILVNAS
jgi:hypothetical protein